MKKRGEKDTLVSVCMSSGVFSVVCSTTAGRSSLANRTAEGLLFNHSLKKIKKINLSQSGE